MKLKYLNPELFEWNNYCGVVGWNWYGQVFLDDKKFAENFEIVGVTDASQLKIKPANGFIAFMLYDKELDEQVWGHVPFYALINLGFITNEQYDRGAIDIANEMKYFIKLLTEAD